MYFDTFKGIVPRTPAHRLDKGYSIVAKDVNLQHGTLKPWRELLHLKTVSYSTLGLEIYGCCYFPWDKCVSVARWIPDCPRLYITGRSDYPEVASVTWKNCVLEYIRLGVLSPPTVPLVSYLTVPDKTIETSMRAYIETWVNELDEESSPSYPSSYLAVNDGQAVTVSFTSTPPAEYKITRRRLYRLSTGFRIGTEKEQIPETDYLFVIELPITTTSYIDTVKDMNLGWALSTHEVKPPPDALSGITAVESTETLCGYVENKLYFTKNGQPWNWPTELELTLDDNIVHIISGDDGTLFVTTTGRPYIVEGVAACGDRPCREVKKLDYPFPDIGCGYLHSAIQTPFGAVYASADGLVALSRNSAPTLITERLLAADDWVQLRPETARLAYYRGYIFCVTDAVSFMLLLDEHMYTEQTSTALMTTFSDTPIDMVRGDSGELIFLFSDGKVMQWDAGTTYRPFEWMMEVFVGRHHWWPAAQIETDGSTTLTISGENGVESIRNIANNSMFRLPRLGRNRKHFVSLTGSAEVKWLRIGETEVNASNGGG